ncbi:MAG: hypothetical protein IKY67_06285 [Paludibacteraceae bacterium]|nr:hypothetical protein [Paludibacteraceae bacterium]
MEKNQVEKLNLGIEPIDAQTLILVESALQWINSNTNIAIDYTTDEGLDGVKANVKLFIIKYYELMNMNAGVSSESLGGMSQSFNTNNKTELLWQYAYELFGDSMMSQMSFVPAKSRW